MWNIFLSPPLVILYVFVASALYIHYRGRVRHPFMRQLTDHSTLMAPYNTLMYLASRVPTTPVIDSRHFPELERLRENWETIRDEVRQLYDAGYVQGARKYNDLAFNSFYRSGWKRFYLKWYDDFHPSAVELCPRTVALLREMPSINAAMFTLLAPGSKLVKHRDPFAGSLRYHLGLITPNSDACRIEIDGQPYSWRDGEHIVFDETYIHLAVNDTDQPRIIFFCDVMRPLRWRPVAWLNQFVVRYLAKATKTSNLDTEQVGILNRIFSVAYYVRVAGKRIRQRSEAAYQVLKWVLILGGIYLIFVLPFTL